MGSEEYMDRLRLGLSDGLPRQELEHVLTYYREYFEEAGAGGEARVIEELGGPGELAADILGQRTQTNAYRGQQPRRGMSTGWKVLLIVCLAPIVVPVGLALIAAAAVTVLGVAAGGVAAIAAGVLAIGAGFSAVFSAGIATTMYFVGLGMLAGGIGAALLAGAVGLAWLCFAGLFRLMSRRGQNREGALE